MLHEEENNTAEKSAHSPPGTPTRSDSAGVSGLTPENTHPNPAQPINTLLPEVPLTPPTAWVLEVPTFLKD